MNYVDHINMTHGGEGTKMYSTAGTDLKKVCMQNKLKLLDASVRHLGTDINYIVLENLYAELKDKIDFFFRHAGRDYRSYRRRIQSAYGRRVIRMRKMRDISRKKRKQMDGKCM